VNGTILALYNRGFYDHELVYEDVADSPNLAVDETTFDVDNNSAVLVTVPIIDEDAIDLEATRHPWVRSLSVEERQGGQQCDRENL